MANKKTTLKTQTGDNVYPNVLRETCHRQWFITESRGKQVKEMKARPLVKLNVL